MKFNKKAHTIKALEGEIETIRKTLKLVSEQTESECRVGKHITRGFATGGRDGEWLIYCLLL